MSGADQNEIDRLIARLRELSLATPEALVAGNTSIELGELLGAFAEDVASALREAERHANAIVASLGDGPGAWAFASAAPAVRRAADVDYRGRWRAGLDAGASAAHQLSRLFSAAAPVVDILAAAEAAALRSPRNR